MPEGFFIDYTLFTSVIIPLGAVAVFAIRYLWKKEKCFIILKNKIESLTRHDASSGETHEGFDERLDEIERKQNKNETYLKLLMDNAGIKYND